MYWCLLQAEHMAIFKMSNGGKLPLTWVQTRNMPVTYKVCTSHTVSTVMFDSRKHKEHS